MNSSTTLSKFSSEIRNRLVRCRNGPVTEVLLDDVYGPLAGRNICQMRVNELAASMMDSALGFKADEPIVISSYKSPIKWWCVNGNHRVRAAAMAGLLKVPARVLDLSPITIGPDTLLPVEHPAIVVSIVEETEARAVRYSVFEEIDLILALIPQYRDFLLKTRVRRTRNEPTVTASGFATWLQSFVSFANFFPSSIGGTSMSTKSATAILRYNRIVTPRQRGLLNDLVSEGKLVVTPGSFRRVMELPQAYINDFIEFVLNYDNSSSLRPMSFMDKWRISVYEAARDIAKEGPPMKKRKLQPRQKVVDAGNNQASVHKASRTAPLTSTSSKSSSSSKSRSSSSSTTSKSSLPQPRQPAINLQEPRTSTQPCGTPTTRPSIPGGKPSPHSQSPLARNVLPAIRSSTNSFSSPLPSNEASNLPARHCSLSRSPKVKSSSNRNNEFNRPSSPPPTATSSHSDKDCPPSPNVPAATLSLPVKSPSESSKKPSVVSSPSPPPSKSPILPRHLLARSTPPSYKNSDPLDNKSSTLSVDNPSVALPASILLPGTRRLQTRVGAAMKRGLREIDVTSFGGISTLSDEWKSFLGSSFDGKLPSLAKQAHMRQAETYEMPEGTNEEKEKKKQFQAKCSAALTVFQNVYMGVNKFSTVTPIQKIAELDLSTLLTDQLGAELSRMDMGVVFNRPEGKSMELSVSAVDDIVKRKFMSEYSISAIHEILGYRLPAESKATFVDSAAVSMLLAEAVPGGSILSPRYISKLNNTGSLWSSIWDSDLTVIPLFQGGHWSVGVLVNLRKLRNQWEGKKQQATDAVNAAIVIVDSLGSRHRPLLEHLFQLVRHHYVSEPSSRARQNSLTYHAALAKQGWSKRNRDIDSKSMNQAIARFFVEDVPQSGVTCGFHTAYNMAIAASSMEALENARFLDDFQRVFRSPKDVVNMTDYIDAVTTRLINARAFYRDKRRPVEMELLNWPEPRLRSSPLCSSAPSTIPCTPSTATKKTQVPIVEVLDSFITSVVKDVVLTLTDMDPENEDALEKRAENIHRALLSIPGSKDKLQKRNSVARKYIIEESRKLI